MDPRTYRSKTNSKKSKIKHKKSEEIGQKTEVKVDQWRQRWKVIMVGRRSSGAKGKIRVVKGQGWEIEVIGFMSVIYGER